MDSLYVAWKYICFHKMRSATLVACISLVAFLPFALELMLDESERQLTARAVETPIVIGAKGSALDLVMSSLYFSDDRPESIVVAAADGIIATDLASAIPLYVRFEARGFPIVGTTLDYFDFRMLDLAEGRWFALLGECVIGASVAENLGLAAGGSLVSSPETVFDLAGVYPLKMKIVGVLEPTHSADDLAVFVDINTAWIIEGLAHGHEDLAATRDPTVILDRSDDNIIASAKLVQYAEITRDNIDSFHFHGDASQFPVTAVIVLPHDQKSGTILRGRYIEEANFQIVRPDQVVDTLMENILRIRNVIDAVIGFVGTATLLVLVLVFALSLRLRQREIDTIFKLGCSKATIARLLGAEIAIIVLIAGVVCIALLSLAGHYDQALVRYLFI
jgi:putative ABC transport system permease protein